MSGGSKIDAEVSNGLAWCIRACQRADRPRFDFRHVHEGEGCLILIGAAAGSRIVGCIQHSVGDHKVTGAARAEATEVSGATIIREVVEACCP